MVVGGCVGVSVEEPANEGGAGGEAGETVEPPSSGGTATGGRGSGGSTAPGGTGPSSGARPATGGEPATGGATATGGSAGSIQHAECGRPLPETLPEVPTIRQNATGRPLFDLWRDISCSAAIEAETCSEASGAGGASSGCLGLCFRGEPSAEDGVCTYGDIDVSCDGEGEVIGYHDGQCWMCSPPEVHARACCEGFAGFDCRAWPFPADGKPGMVCARHEDCEAGLVCGPGGTYASGYGICQCPGVTVELADFCDFIFDGG